MVLLDYIVLLYCCCNIVIVVIVIVLVIVVVWYVFGLGKKDGGVRVGGVLIE